MKLKRNVDKVAQNLKKHGVSFKDHVADSRSSAGFFKQTGKRYQSRINAVLRAHVEAHGQP